MNVSSQRYVIPTTHRHLTPTGWFTVIYFGAIFVGLIAFHFVF